jgi:hypothetical protein
MASDAWFARPAYESHRTSRAEIAGLIAHAERCTADGAAVGISAETRHAALHNAVIYLAKAALAADGFRTTESHHYWSIESLQHTVGLGHADVAILHAHRKKRHQSSYQYDGMVSDDEVAGLLALATDLAERVRRWLAASHPELA